MKLATKKFSGALLTAILGLAAQGIYSVAAPANARSANIPRKTLEAAQIAGTDEELRMMLIQLPPGFSAIEHRHPVVGVCYVLEGIAESQYEGEDILKLGKGQSFQDSATKVHLLFRNPSKTETLKFTCTAKIKKDQPYLQPK